jgi:hypothetical protein
MSNPVASGMATIVGTAVGTTVVLDHPGSLLRVIIPVGYNGTVNLCDSASGTTATAWSIPTTVGTIPTSIELGIALHAGLVAETTGTSKLIIVTE